MKKDTILPNTFILLNILMNSKLKSKKKPQRKKAGYFVKPVNDVEKFWTNKLKAIIYVRVSSEGQVTQWNGLESQETVCRERCEKQPWLEIEVSKVFREEGVSGSTMDRKAMNEAIKFLETENKKYTKIHYFVVTDADRIARPDDIAEAFTLEQNIEILWVKIITANNKRDTETDEGKFIHTIQYAIAGLERRKILRRTMNGRLNSLKKGGRPFTYPPLGYLRKRGTEILSENEWSFESINNWTIYNQWTTERSKRGYSDIIDDAKWPIIKEGLEHYAYNPLFTKSQLHQFRVEKGLQTSQSRGRLHLSYIEKILRDHRLYFYAGYIYYPERGVDQLVYWKHAPLISLAVAEKIIEKEKKLKRPSKKTPNLDENLELHPLKWLITCEGCGRKLGCYKTTKKKTKAEYFYYDCGNKYCEKRQYIPKETMESRFEELVGRMKLPKKVFDVYKSYILEQWELRNNQTTDTTAQMQKQIFSIQDRMKKIEEKILFISNDALTKKLEDERSTLEVLQGDFIKKMNPQQNEEDDLETILLQAETIFTNPVGMRKEGNFEIRQLLFRVRFAWILYYEKNLWYRTNETTGLHYIFSPKWGDDFHEMAQVGVHSNFLNWMKTDIEITFSVLFSQREYIRAVYKTMEIKEWLVI